MGALSVTCAAVAVAVLTLLSACGSDDPGPEPFDDQGCTNLAFTQVNPNNTSNALETEVRAALQLLCETAADGNLAYESYKSIATGLVQIDTIEDFTDLDYETVLVFWEIDPQTTTRAEAMAIIEQDILGYMWGNRIYIVLGSTATSLAATLLHEVNHVLNRSDENYYLPIGQQLDPVEETNILNALTVDDGAGFREEYRAFYLEEVFAGAPLDIGDQQSMRALKIEIRDLYGFQIDVDAFPDVPEGVLVPDEQGWAAQPASLCRPDLTYFPCAD